MDPLSDVLALLKPQSYLTAGFDAGGTWAVRFNNQAGTIKCYAVSSGACWLAVDGVAGRIRLAAGDCFVLPSGRPFTLASDLALTPVAAAFMASPMRAGSTSAAPATPQAHGCWPPPVATEPTGRVQPWKTGLQLLAGQAGLTRLFRLGS